jgi:hypothetical protein
MTEPKPFDIMLTSRSEITDRYTIMAKVKMLHRTAKNMIHLLSNQPQSSEMKDTKLEEPTAQVSREDLELPEKFESSEEEESLEVPEIFESSAERENLELPERFESSAERANLELREWFQSSAEKEDLFGDHSFDFF